MNTISVLVKDISSSLNVGEDDIFIAAKKKIEKSGLNIRPLSCSVYKRSVDARKKNDIRLVYSVLVECERGTGFDAEMLEKHSLSLIEKNDISIKTGDKDMCERPLIVGMGPAGIFCALLLAEHGYKPIVIERGDDVDTRLRKKEEFYNTHILDTESNIQFGAGGAGTFSDGKLVTRINDPLCNYVLRVMHEFGAPDEILYKAKPHVGTDRLLSLVKEADKRIRELGGEIYYRTRLDDIRFDSCGRVVSATVNNTESIPCGCIVLCLGHSARDTYLMRRNKDICMMPKPFSVGVRIEHLREDIDRALYGDFAFHPALGPAEYNLSHNTKKRGVYTFCMCPGGEVVAATSEENTVVVNGMSNFARDGVNSNCAVAVSVFESDHGGTIESAIEFQRKLEQLAYSEGGGNYSVPVTTVGDFFEKNKSSAPARVKPTYMNGDNYRLCNFFSFMPRFIYDSLCDGLSSFDKKINGFASSDAVLSAFETRTSAPLRIVRDDKRAALGHDNLYPRGEGAGYAGGITSAALDGIKTAISIIEKYRPIA